MNAGSRSPRVSFSKQHGREVYESGDCKRWRCPVCAWWRDWEEERCCGCGLARDDPATARPKARAAGAAS